jgi:hypothetical protein
VRLLLPTGSEVVLSVATPEVSVPVPMLTPLLLKVMVSPVVVRLPDE